MDHGRTVYLPLFPYTHTPLSFTPMTLELSYFYVCWMIVCVEQLTAYDDIQLEVDLFPFNSHNPSVYNPSTSNGQGENGTGNNGNGTGEGETRILDWHAEVHRILSSKGSKATKKKGTSLSRHSEEDQTDHGPTSTSASAHPDPDHNTQNTQTQQQNNQQDYYDTADPFIDDDEDYFAEQMMYRPLHDGYFVWKGGVDVPHVIIQSDHESDSVSSGGTAAGGEEEGQEITQGEQPLGVSSNDDSGHVISGVERWDMENVKRINEPAVASATPKKKRTDNDGLIMRKRKKKKTVDDTLVTAATIGAAVATIGAAVPSAGISGMPSMGSGDFINPPPTVSTVPASTVVNMDIDSTTTSIPPLLNTTNNEEKEKKLRVKKPLLPLPEGTNTILSQMKTIISTIEFKKGKLPGGLVEPLTAFARTAIAELGGSYELFRDGEGGRVYWMHLKDILPFQSSTLKKLVDKQVLAVDVERQDAALRELYASSRACVGVCLENSVTAFEQKLAKWKSENPDILLDEDGKIISTAADDSAAAPAVAVETPDGAEGTEESTTATGKDKKNLPPTKKLIWTNDLRTSIYKIVTLEFDLIPIKRRLKDAGIPLSAQPPFASSDDTPPICSSIITPELAKTDLITRRTIYQHIMQYVFAPLGAAAYVTTTEISRQYNLTRSKEEPKAPKLSSMSSTMTTATVSNSQGNSSSSNPVSSNPSTPQKAKKERKPRPKKESLVSSQPTIPVDPSPDRPSIAPTLATEGNISAPLSPLNLHTLNPTVITTPTGHRSIAPMPHPSLPPGAPSQNPLFNPQFMGMGTPFQLGLPPLFPQHGLEMGMTSGRSSPHNVPSLPASAKRTNINAILLDQDDEDPSKQVINLL